MQHTHAVVSRVGVTSSGAAVGFPHPKMLLLVNPLVLYLMELISES